MDNGSARELFKQFVTARKQAGLPTKGITYGALVQRLAREAPKLREQHGDVRFEVHSEGGKVRLRARSSRG